MGQPPAADLPEEALLDAMAPPPLGVFCSFRLDAQGHPSLAHSSPALFELFGLTPEALARTLDPILAGTVPEDLPRLREAVNASAAGLTPCHLEFRIANPTRGEIWVEAHAMPQRETDGGTLWQCYLQDITARQRAADRVRRFTRELCAERDLLRAALDGAPNAQIAYLDRDFNFLGVNAAYAKGCGYAPAAMIGLNHFALYPNAEAESIFALVRDSGLPAAFHDRPFTFPDQPERGLTYWDWVLTPIRDSESAVVGLVLSLTETTRRKRAEEALKASQADLNRAQTLGRIGSWRIEIPTREATWSSENHRIWGQAGPVAPDFDGFLTAVHPADRAYVRGRWEAALAGEECDFEHRILVGGKVRWVRERAELDFDAQGAVRSVFGTTQDITERREAADQLRSQLRLTKAITDCVAEAIFVTDDQGRVTFVNPEAERTFGYAAQELLGRVLHEEIHHRHPDAQDDTWCSCPLPALFEGREQVRNGEVVYRRKDGSTLTGAVSRTPLEVGGEHRGAVLVVHDISEIKRAQAALLDADRRKDEFLAMLAHELRNPLAPIRNAAHVMSRMPTSEPRVRWAHRMIEQQAAHLSRVVDDLLDVSRFSRGEVALNPVRVDFNEVARQVVDGARHLIESKGHSCELDLPLEPLWLDADLVRLSQILVHLIDNAVKYTAPPGRLRLTAKAEPTEIEVVVEDNGMGIAPDLLPYVFDLFQQGGRTLDRSKGGLGLGLTLVRRLVQAHGGRVMAESDCQIGGTRIRLWLPRPPLHEAESSPTPAEPPAGPRLRILVVDDEAAVADSTALMLRLDGHSVQVARSGAVAIQLAASFEPEVVLLDIGLRGMDGFQTARQLRARHPGSGLCLIAVTGYGDAQARERADAAGFDHYLVKPVEPDRLKGLLAELAGEPATDAPSQPYPRDRRN